MCEEALKLHPRGKRRTQILSETILITQILDDILIRKGILSTVFGNIYFRNNIITLDLICIF